MPLRGAAAEDHHARWRGRRARHRVLVVPQRPAARVGARAGGAHRRRPGRGGHGRQRARRPVPGVSRTRTGRSATRCGCASTSSRSSRTCGCATCGSTTPRSASPSMGQVCADSAYEGERVDFVDGTVFGPREQYLTLATFVGPGAGGQRLHRDGRSTTGRCSGGRSDFLTVRDYLWRWDTDWFWCSRAFGVQQPLVRRLWPQPLPAVGRVPAAGRARPPAPAHRPGRQGCAVSRPRSTWCRTSRCRSSSPSKFLDFFHREVGIEPVWLCPLRLRADARRGRSTRWSPTSCTSTWASGPASPLKPGQADGYLQPADRGDSQRRWAGTSRCTPRCTTRKTSSGSATTATRTTP